MKALFLGVLLFILVGCDSNENSINPINPGLSSKVASDPVDLGLSGKWIIWFKHPSSIVSTTSLEKVSAEFAANWSRPNCKISITFETMLERFWLDIDPEGPFTNRTWNSKSLYGQTTPSSFSQRCDYGSDPPYVEDGRLWEWGHYWWKFIFPSDDLLTGTVEGIMYKHPFYYLSWNLSYTRKTLEDLYRFQGTLTLETGGIVNFWGRQTRRDPFVIIPLNTLNKSKELYFSE